MCIISSGNFISKDMIKKSKVNYQTLTVKLPKEWAEHLLFLEKTTPKNKDYYICESLVRYLEDLEDLEIGLVKLKKKKKVYYTPKEADKKLAELLAAKAKHTSKKKPLTNV